MRRWRRVVLLAIPLLALASLVRGQAPRGEAGLTGEYTNSWALLIGVDRTPRKATLNSVADAGRMRDALIKIGFPRNNIKILANPKGAEIREVILRPFAGMGANDRYVVYFSGHGDYRVLRGGGWYSDPIHLRTTYREGSDPLRNPAARGGPEPAV